jgi:hypothetical protein
MWRARAYAAMSALRVLAALRAVDMADVDSEDMLLEIRRTLEKEVVRRLAFESSAAVRKILQQGEAFAAEVSCDLWTTPLQNTAISYSQAAMAIKGDIRVTMQVRVSAQPVITLPDTRTFDSLRQRLSCSRRGTARSISMRATRTSSRSGLCCTVLQRRSSTPCTATWRRVHDARTAKSFDHIMHHPVTSLSPCCI